MMAAIVLSNMYFFEFITMLLNMSEQVRTDMNSNLKQRLADQHISYKALARILCVSSLSICKKVNGSVSWQASELYALNKQFGLSCDFLLGFCDKGKVLQPV